MAFTIVKSVLKDIDAYPILTEEVGFRTIAGIENRRGHGRRAGARFDRSGRGKSNRRRARVEAQGR